MEALLKELNQLGEITANNKPYKIEDHGALYKTFHSCSVRNEMFCIELGYNVFREKVSDHMKGIEVFERTQEHYYCTVIDLITPNIERVQILSDTSTRSLGHMSIEEITTYLKFTNEMFVMCFPKSC